MRIKLEVYIDLDPTPGAMHSKESARNLVAGALNNVLGPYKPTVSTTNYEGETQAEWLDRHEQAEKTSQKIQRI